MAISVYELARVHDRLEILVVPILRVCGALLDHKCDSAVPPGFTVKGKRLHQRVSIDIVQCASCLKEAKLQHPGLYTEVRVSQLTAEILADDLEFLTEVLVGIDLGAFIQDAVAGIAGRHHQRKGAAVRLFLHEVDGVAQLLAVLDLHFPDLYKADVIAGHLLEPVEHIV